MEHADKFTVNDFKFDRRNANRASCARSLSREDQIMEYAAWMLTHVHTSCVE